MINASRGADGILFDKAMRKELDNVLICHRDNFLGNGPVCVYLYLLARVRRNGVGRFHLRRLAKVTGKSVRLCNRYLTLLMRAGLLRMKLVSKRNFVYDFRLVLDSEGPNLA